MANEDREAVALAARGGRANGAAAGAEAVGTAARAATAPARLGLIGAGRWGRNYIHTVETMPDARLTWLSSQHPHDSDLVGEGCRFSTDWRAVIDSGEIDGVIIATPAPLHAEMVAHAIAAGIGVMVEKPLTHSLAEAERLRDLSRRHDVPIVVDHTLLFHPGFQTLKALMPAIGPARTLASIAGNYGPFRPDTLPFEDWAPHSLAMCLWLAGEAPATVEARAVQRRAVIEGIGENIEVAMTFSGGLAARVLVGNLFDEKRRRFEVEGAAGRLVFSDINPETLVLIDDAGRTGLEFETEPPLTRGVRALTDALAGRRSALVGIDLGVEVVRLMEACRRQIAGAG